MIQVKNVHKSFGRETVLTDVSLTIEEGETIAIIGQSGSGKTVLMKHMIGLITPDQGRVLVDGKDINNLKYDELRKVRRQFGVLFQGGALFDSMSAFENVAFPLRTFTEDSEQEVTERVEECLRVVNLDDIEDQKPADLSGGMRKRVALARAIALTPKYILYDEPTSGLDPQTSNTINRLIIDLAQQLSSTSVVVTHDMHSVLEVADRVVFLYDSRLHWSGTIEELNQSEDDVLLDFVTASEYQIGSAEARMRRSIS